MRPAPWIGDGAAAQGAPRSGREFANSWLRTDAYILDCPALHAAWIVGVRMMKRQTQISVFTDNRPGTLARITAALGKRGVNIIGVAAWGETDHGVIRMVVDEPLKALHLLGEHGMMCTESKVLGIHLPNTPGTLNQVANLLGKKKVNVDYCYGSDSPEGGVLYLKVDDLSAAEEALKNSSLTAPKGSKAPRKAAKPVAKKAARTKAAKG